MVHPLQQRVAAVERRVRRLGWMYAWGRFLIALIAVVLAACLVDYFLRVQDRGIRVIVSLAVAALLGWLFVRLVLPLRGARYNLVEVAQKIESRFPQLGERLSSGIAFLAQSEQDPTAGSADLRRAVVAQAESLSHDLDFQAAVEARAPRRVMAVLFLFVVFVGVLAALAHNSARIALTRLALPWADFQWPARHALAFENPPAKIASGDNFEISVIDKNGKLPETVSLQIRHEVEGRTRVETREMKLLGDRMTFRLDNVTQPFEYRAFGGDDHSLPWMALFVVTPPKIVDVAVEIDPPAYTGKKKETGGKLVRILAGSALTVRGKTDKQILSAKLRSETAGAALPAVEISADGHSFSAPAKGAPPWRAEKSATYWFELSGSEELPGGRDVRLEVQVLPDAQPSISWDTPSDHAFVTPRALVPVKCLVKDDLSVRSVSLKYLRPDASDQGEFVVVLYRGPEKARPQKGTDGGESRTIETTWDLASVAGLQVGSVLAVRIVADDYKPQEATTAARRITIISDEELENRVTQKQTAILEQLAEVLRMQRDARAQTAALEIKLRETGKLTPQELTHLEAAELNQRNVQRLLGDPQDGVETQIVALLAELESNKIANQAASRRMTDLLEKVRAVNREPLPVISREMTAAVKAARAAVEAEGEKKSCADYVAETSRSLGTAGTQQDDVIARLEALLGELSQWDSFSRLAREVSQIRQDQEKLARDTETLQLKMAASEATEASEHRAAAKQLAQRQLELARRFDKLQTRMEELLGRLRQTDPLVAGTLADALDAGRRLAIGGQMRTAASDLGEQRLGPASLTEATVLQGLKDLLDLLSHRRDQELARGIKSLGEAAGELDNLAARQAALQKELDAAAANKNEAAKKRELQRLTKELKQLAEEVQELARKLERLQARKAASAGKDAGSAIGQAGEAAEAGNAEESQNQSRTAKDLLDEARAQLREQIKQAEQDLQREELARLEQLIQGLVTREKSVLAETARLEGLRDKKTGQLTPPQLASLRGIAGEQRTLMDETAQMETSVAAAKAFVFSLEGAQREMLKAASGLERLETSEGVQRAESAAVARLEQLLAALKPEPSQPSENPMEDPPPGGQQGGPQPTLQNLAELKLLKLMQETIHTRTAELEEVRRKNGDLSEDELAELETLARDQGKLADMVLEMIKAAAERPEDDLEKLLNPGDKPEEGRDNKKQPHKEAREEKEQ